MIAKEKLKSLNIVHPSIRMDPIFPDNTKKLKGEFFIDVINSDGSILEQRHFPNIIVDSSSLLIARLLADGQATIDPTGPAHGLWVLALGTGDPSWDKQNPPTPLPTTTQLVSELTRKRFTSVTFIKTDGSGLPSTTITNILDFQCILSESEAVGAILELGSFGGDADESIANSGQMLNYRCMAVINKPSTATMSIIFRITT